MPTPNKAIATVTQSDIVIPNGQHDSAEIDLTRVTLVGLFMPAAFDGTLLQFKVAKALGGSYVDMLDGTTPMQVSVAAAGYVKLQPSDFVGISAIKLSATTQQTADRTFTLVKRPI